MDTSNGCDDVSCGRWRKPFFQARARVAAVHHGRQFTALREVLDEYFKQLVVRNLPGALVVAGNDRLVIPVGLVAGMVAYLAAMTAKMEEQAVAALGASHQPPEALDDVRPRRHRLMRALP